MCATVALVLVDNGIESQNQDYGASRIILQKGIVSDMINLLIAEELDNQLGIIPLYQEVKNDIVTPLAYDKMDLLNFINKLDLSENNTFELSFYQSRQTLQTSNLSDKKVFIFLSSTIEYPSKVIYDIATLIDTGSAVYVACFGSAVDFGSILKSEFNDGDCQILIITPEEDFDLSIEKFYLTQFDDNEDENYKLALQQSLIEK
ncbi:hypothetical protein HERIO_972 [Hepatospora eriocheir]|uniref:VWFA domain-containing protein n=1 Tax=Hepatospora eriocheir TaxID=1081669 RepID=A0A1X0QBT2_9MICR|nr:hypothetical protein HERIO_972 [Hepatospora eriocheir]